jgi:uncharacterized membrane protein
MGWMWIWWLLGIVALIAIVRAVAPGGWQQGPTRESAEEILRRRYASGEIDEEEYQRMLRTLRM